MEMDQKELDELKKELDKLSRSVSTIGDSVKVGVRDGIKEGNADERKRKTNTDDSDLAEKANAKLLLRHKEEYDASKDMYKSKIKTPEQEFQEKTLKIQFNTNSYLEQLLKLTRENQEFEKKNVNIDSKGKAKEQKPGFIENLSAYKDDANPYTKLIGNMADLGLQGKKLFTSAKEKITDRKSGSTARKKEIDTSIKEINREKALLSAEEAKLEKLKKARGKNRNEDAIKEMEEAVSSRKNSIKTKADKFADNTAEEYLYQKGKSDKNFRFQGAEKDLITDQLRDNIYHSTTKDIFPEKKSAKEKATVKEDTILDKLDKILSANFSKTVKSDDISDVKAGRKSKGYDSENKLLAGTVDKKDISVFDIKLKEASNPSTSGEYIVGIYKELRKKKETESASKAIEAAESTESGGGIMGLLGSIGPALSAIGPALGAIGPALAAVGVAVGGAVALKATYDKMEQSKEGTTLGDVGGGISSWLTTGDFSKGLEDTQVERMHKINKKEMDANMVAGSTEVFNRDQVPLFAKYRKYVTDGDLEGLKEDYIDFRVGNSTYVQYKAKRNKLLRQAKEMQIGESQIDAEFNELTGANTTPQANKPTPSGGKEGSKQSADTKSSTATMGQYSGMDQMTAMTIQAKLIAMEMMNMNTSPDYINKQKELMRSSGIAMANKLTGE